MLCPEDPLFLSYKLTFAVVLFLLISSVSLDKIRRINPVIFTGLFACFLAFSSFTLPPRVSSLTSKWIGQGEKLVRVLFTVASIKAPSVIFIDEIDSLLTKRSGKCIQALCFSIFITCRGSISLTVEITDHAFPFMLHRVPDSENESTRRIKTEFLVQLDGVGSSTEGRILVVS